MQIRDRIRELRRVKASELRPNPRNWRLHNDEQRACLQGLLAEVGFADALLARECDDGSLQLIDGHLRAETTPDQLVPVLVLDVDEREAELILATHDPLTNMAGTDEAQLRQLIDRCEPVSPAVESMLQELIAEAQKPQQSPSDHEGSDQSDELRDTFEIVVNCQDEADQRDLLERLNSEGYRCRALIS